MSEKSIVIFTNFWDANNLIDESFILIHQPNNKIYKINFYKEKNDASKNYSVYSIALGHPNIDNKLKNLKGIERLDFFCPTYDLLKKYKNDHDWSYYQKRYPEIIQERKRKIQTWFRSLKEDHVYFLCCWENTKRGIHCHRELLYKMFLDSKKACEKIIPIYRHGNNIKNDKAPNYFIHYDVSVPLTTNTMVDVVISDGSYLVYDDIGNVTYSTNNGSNGSNGD
jgi:hypothetical protein